MIDEKTKSLLVLAANELALCNSSPYPSQVRELIRRGIGKVDDYLQGARSAASYNARLKAAKWLVRNAADQLSMASTDRDRLELRLGRIKQRKTRQGNIEDKVPTEDEIRLLIVEADQRLRLMIRFLWESGCRVSEMIGAEITATRRGASWTRIPVTQKGGHDHELMVTTDLYDGIRAEFAGSRFLFEHSNRQYSRVSVSQRIKQLAERVIHKPVTAHGIRHARGTKVSEEAGIAAAQEWLGHSDIRTTRSFYDHHRMSDVERERLL